MIRLNIADPALHGEILPESIFDKVEEVELKRALNPLASPFVALTREEYAEIADKVVSASIGITVSDFYGVPSYYSVMPQDIFDALELAALNDEATCMVGKAQFDKMIADYKAKMNHE